MPPTGLGYLAQSLIQAGIEYAVEDMRVRNHLSGLRKKIRAFQPDLIGLSLVSLEYKRSYELIRYIKKYYPRAPIIVGGAHVSAIRESVLEECPAIDLGLVGEAERALDSIDSGLVDQEVSQIPSSSKSHRTSREPGGSSESDEPDASNRKVVVTFPEPGVALSEARGGMFETEK